MLKNYLLIALRHLWKYRFYSTIHILGLAIGMACSLLILTHVRHEWQYDRFHEDPEEIYRVHMRYEVQGNPGVYPILGYVWADYMRAAIPQVKSAIRLYRPRKSKITIESSSLEEQGIFYADSNYTDVFNLAYVQGDPDEALHAPNRIVLSYPAARRYFGDRDPLGQVFFFNDSIKLTVSGVVEPYPSNAHFHFDGLISMPTLLQVEGRDHALFLEPQYISCYTYLRTQDPEASFRSLVNYYETHLNERARAFMKGPFLMPLTDIHLHSQTKWELGTNGNALSVDIFLAVALLILFMSAVNFVNLATAMASKRQREVGLRKVVGARRRDLIFQYLGESMLITLSALPLALILAGLLRWLIRQSTGLNIRFSIASDPFFWMLLLFIIIFLGWIAGGYPAFFLSRIRLVEALRGTPPERKGKVDLRKLLVTLQIALSTALIIATGILLQQLDYLQNKAMGFEKEWRLVIPLPEEEADTGIRGLAAHRLKTAFDQQVGVIGTSATTSVPGGLRLVTWLRVEGQPEETVHQPFTISIDFEYADVMELHIEEGRNFDAAYGSDSTRAVLVNEAALHSLGLSEPAVGTKMIFMRNGNFGTDDPEGPDWVRIIGVIKDVHFEPLYQEIQPLILRVRPEEWNYLMVHLRADNWEQTLGQLEQSWKELVPDTPFRYSFLEDDLLHLYEKEAQLGTLITFFTLLAILIAVLGLFGMAALRARQRRREMSIRKVFGAGTLAILSRLSGEFLILVLLAFPFASLLAWWGSRIWLQTFAYRAPIGIGVYLLALLLSTGIALVAVFYHAYQSATRNPADVLSQE